MEDGGWRMRNREWRMENGGWRLFGVVEWLGRGIW